jgi:hypothetical protein
MIGAAVLSGVIWRLSGERFAWVAGLGAAAVALSAVSLARLRDPRRDAGAT